VNLSTSPMLQLHSRGGNVTHDSKDSSTPKRAHMLSLIPSYRLPLETASVGAQQKRLLRRVPGRKGSGSCCATL
jgi:hypothetical protein